MREKRDTIIPVPKPARLPLESWRTAFVDILLRWSCVGLEAPDEEATESSRTAAGLKNTAVLRHVQGPMLAARIRPAWRKAIGRAMMIR